MRLCFIIILLSVSFYLNAQKTTISEKYVEFTTYDFSGADPVPLLSSQKELYPYHKFTAYTNTPIQKKWKVVTLENEYLKVEILPEIGGKILGITEKKSGYDIIYRNDVVKFRNIASRGPWTSGGIEFNFGFFGHTPYASTRVNYKTEIDTDGCGVCALGATDLPSQSDWRVKIILPPDKAYIKIDCGWTNTTVFTQSYYYWTNAAVHTGDDLRFFYPGTHQIGHGGDAHLFPVDEEKRDLSFYKNNAFGSNKSYHIVGDNKPYKAVYWADKQIGVGSYADKFNILGKKLWIWSMAPSGNIWKELLSNNSGQYIEIQSGRLYNQASPESGVNTPYTQGKFLPYQSDSWSEYWYPVINTGGVSDASPYGVLHVEQVDPGSAEIRIMALSQLNTNVSIEIQNGTKIERTINLQPTETYVFTIPTKGYNFEVSVQGADLFYSSSDPVSESKRPIKRSLELKEDPVTTEFVLAEEKFKYRQYREAEEHYKKYLKVLPYSIQALVRMGEICMVTNRAEEAEQFLYKALEIDTYHGEANLLFGVLSKEKKDYNTAEECFGVAAQSRAVKVSAYIEAAKLFVLNKKYNRAIEMCLKAQEFDVNNTNILRLLTLAYRKTGDMKCYNETLSKIEMVDVLNTFVPTERALINNNEALLPKEFVHNEYHQEIILSLALYYESLGMADEAVRLLKTIDHFPKALYWLANLDKKNANDYLTKADKSDIQFIFPYRNETTKILEYSASLSDSWKIPYYRALLSWKCGDIENAGHMFLACGNPDSPVFYSVIASFYQSIGQPDKAIANYRKHLDMDKSDWRVYHKLLTLLKGESNLQEAIRIAGSGVRSFSNEFVLQYDYANLLLVSGRYKEALKILETIEVLPAEHTGSAYPAYFAANILEAVYKIKQGKRKDAIKYLEDSKQWPSRLGGGFGYTTDFSLQEMLLKYCIGSNIDTEKEEFINKILEQDGSDINLKNYIQAYKSGDKAAMKKHSVLIEKQITETYSVSHSFIYLNVLHSLL